MRHFERSPRAFPVNAQAIPGTVTSMSKYVNPILEKFTNGLSFIWGTECRVKDGNEWDIWDNQSQ